jgi:ribosomal-protein-serine acetyltransferase
MSKDIILTDAPMPIITPRLVLRPLQEGDGAALHSSKSETWDKLTKVFQWANKLPNPEQNEAYARRSFASYILREDFNLVGINKETNEHVLYIGIHPLNWGLREFQIGYWVRGTSQGKGYAREAANALMRYTFSQLGANRLVMCHVEGNHASQKIIESLGLEYEGIRKNSLLFAGGIVCDAHWYSRVDAHNLPQRDVNWN